MFSLTVPSLAWAQGESISYGDTVIGTITNEEPLHTWTFEGADGDTITITMEATNLADGGLDSYLELLDPSGTVIAENDDASNATINAAIENFPLTEDGTYTIHATRFGQESGTATGDYSLSLQLASEIEASPTDEAPPTTDSPEFNIGRIAFDEPVQGELSTQNFAELWDFDAEAGTVVSVQMIRLSDDLDTYVIIIDDQGNELISNDDGIDGTASSEIEDYELPYTGLFSIVATRYGFESGTSRGQYELTLTTGELQTTTAQPTATPQPEPTIQPTPEPLPFPDDAIALTYGQSINGLFEDPNQQDFYQFEGKAGDIVVASVKRTSGEFDPIVTLLDAAQNVLVRNYDFNGSSDARIAGYQLPADGIYLITIYAESLGEGEYLLRLFTTDAISPAAEDQNQPETGSSIQNTDRVGDNVILIFTLTWDATDDFDLVLIDPNAATLNYQTFTSPSGGVFAGDANGACERTVDTPSESAYWEVEAPPGLYGIGVGHVLNCDNNTDPVHYVVTVTLNGEIVETFEGDMIEGDFETFTYELE